MDANVLVQDRDFPQIASHCAREHIDVECFLILVLGASIRKCQSGSFRARNEETAATITSPMRNDSSSSVIHTRLLSSRAMPRANLSAGAVAPGFSLSGCPGGFTSMRPRISRCSAEQNQVQ